MSSIAGNIRRPGLGHLSNTDSNDSRPLDIPLKAGDATQATTPMPLSNGDQAAVASDTSDSAEFDVNTNGFQMTQDGFKTRATIGGLHFHLR